jgi:L-iditol 2-dehydrogenase
MASALTLAAVRGRVVYVGINVGACGSAPLGEIVNKGLEIRGQVGSAGVWPAALRFLDRTRPDLAALVTRQFPLEQAGEAVVAAERRSEHVKVQVLGT